MPRRGAERPQESRTTADGPQEPARVRQARGNLVGETAFESRYPTRRSELVVGGIAGVDGESSAGIVLTPLK